MKTKTEKRPQGFAAFIRKLNEKPLTEGQAARVIQLVAAAKEIGAESVKPKPVTTTKPAARGVLRRLITPQTATVWRGSMGGGIVRAH